MFAESSLPEKGVSDGQHDRTVMVTVQELINSAMGPPEGNKVNFKLIQKILHILASQMRIQEQFVDFGYEESTKQSPASDRKRKHHAFVFNAKENEKTKLEKMTDKERAEYESQKVKHRDMEKEPTLAKMTGKESVEHESQTEKVRDIEEIDEKSLAKMSDEERANYESQKATERDMDENEEALLAKMSDEERANYESQKATERDMDENEEALLATMTDKERAEYESQKAKQRDMEEKPTSAKITSKERAEYESQTSKERDIEEEPTLSKMTSKEITEYESQKAKERDMDEEPTLAKITSTERAEYESEKAKEQDLEEEPTLAKMTSKETSEYESQKVKELDMEEEPTLSKMTSKERTEYESQKAKERDMDEEPRLAKITSKETSEYESQKAKELDMEEEPTLAKITSKETAEYESQKVKDLEMEEEPPLAKIISKESTEYESLKAKELDMEEELPLAKITSKESTEYESQKAKELDIEEEPTLAKITSTERAEYESQKAKEQDLEEEPTLAKITSKETSEYESQKAKELDMEEKPTLAKITSKEKAESESQTAKEQDMEEEPTIAKIASKKSTEYESQKAKELDMKEKPTSAKITRKKFTKETAEYKSQKVAKREMEGKEKAKLKEPEKGKVEKMTDEERLEIERQKAKERIMEEKARLSELTDKERADYESHKSKKQVMEEKRQALIARIAEKRRQKAGITAKVTDKQLRVGSMQVVTRAEFELLEGRVEDLEERVAPIPYPLMPGNWKIRQELSIGSLSLTESMEALQMMARVQAAEEAVIRMADVLTMLLTENEAAEGAARKMKREAPNLSKFLEYDESYSATKFHQSKIDKAKPKPSKETKADKPTEGETSTKGGGETSTKGDGSTEKDESMKGEKLQISFKQPRAFVTHADLDFATGVLRDDMLKKGHQMTQNSHKAAQKAEQKVDSLVEVTTKLTNMETRVNKLDLLVDDTAQQLASLDLNKIDNQMASFNGQLQVTQSELRDGIKLFEQTFNKETEDVKHLKCMFADILTDQDMSSWSHKQLTGRHDELAEEMKRQLEFLERLKEDKVDKEMLMDGLWDKANRSELEGLLRDDDFKITAAAMNRVLTTVENKFDLQDEAWLSAMQEMQSLADSKADIKDLLNQKAEFEEHLMQLQQGMNQMSKTLEGPKAALLIRQIAMRGQCGACTNDAVPEGDVGNLPPRLPAAVRRHIPTSDVVCEVGIPPPPPPPPLPPPPPPPLDNRLHICRRWVGGSHTTVSANVVRTDAPPPIVHPSTKKYTMYGEDGKMYMMEELQPPCLECTQPDVTDIVVDGAGDTGVTSTSP